MYTVQCTRETYSFIQYKISLIAVRLPGNTFDVQKEKFS